MIFSVMLLQGVKSGRRQYIVPWLVWSILYIAIATGSAIYEVTLQEGQLYLRIVKPIMYLLVITLWIYCVHCVFRYHRALAKNKRELVPMFDFEDDLDDEISQFKHFTHPKLYQNRSIWESTSTSSIDMIRTQSKKHSKKHETSTRDKS